MNFHSPIRILILAALLFPGTGAAGAAGHSTAAFGEMPIAVDKVAERAALQIRINEYKARPKVPLIGVPIVSLSECVQGLDTERFINFDPTCTKDWMNWDLARKILHQPRVAQVLLETFNGNPDVREEVLSEVIPLVRRHVEDFEKRLAGQEASGVRSANQGLAFPIVLAEVDSSGSSLPLLLAWYELEGTGARGLIDALIARGTVIPDVPDFEARSEVMEIIAPAALVILNSIRTSASNAAGTTTRVPAWDRELEDLLDTRPSFNPWREAFGPSVVLAGYEQLPRLDPKQCNAVMQIVREYLEGL